MLDDFAVPFRPCQLMWEGREDVMTDNSSLRLAILKTLILFSCFAKKGTFALAGVSLRLPGALPERLGEGGRLPTTSPRPTATSCFPSGVTARSSTLDEE